MSLNPGEIGALLVALLVYNGQLLIGGNWALAPLATDIDFWNLRIVLGLLIVVQGFETSRYLLIPHDQIQDQITLAGLAARYEVRVENT